MALDRKRKRLQEIDVGEKVCDSDFHIDYFLIREYMVIETKCADRE